MRRVSDPQKLQFISPQPTHRASVENSIRTQESPCRTTQSGFGRISSLSTVRNGCLEDCPRHSKGEGRRRGRIKARYLWIPPFKKRLAGLRRDTISSSRQYT